MVARMLTVVLTYYEAPNMLAQHLACMQGYPDNVRLVLVDDGSQQHPADLSACPIPYEHWRIHEDRPWHQHAARNLGMSVAHGLCLLTDIDHVLKADQARKAIAATPRRGVALCPQREWPDGAPRGKTHPNSYLLHAADYWAAGGYDERLCGYYGTDARFRRQLLRHAASTQTTNAFTLTLYEGVIADACAPFERKQSRYHVRQYPEAMRVMRDDSKTAANNRFLFTCERVAKG